MNIYAQKGFKVVLARWASGLAKKQLVTGKEYTVELTKVYSSSTDVFLQEIPGAPFNSVNFEDVYPQSKDDDKRHRDWKKYN